MNEDQWSRDILSTALYLHLFEFFTVNTKVPEVAILASKEQKSKKTLSPVENKLMITASRNYYRFKSLMLNPLS